MWKVWHDANLFNQTSEQLRVSPKASAHPTHDYVLERVPFRVLASITPLYTTLLVADVKARPVPGNESTSPVGCPNFTP